MSKPDGRHPDAETIRSLCLLTDGRPEAFADTEPLPDQIMQFVRRARIGQIRELLMLTLRRWHQIKSPPAKVKTPAKPRTTRKPTDQRLGT